MTEQQQKQSEGKIDTKDLAEQQQKQKMDTEALVSPQTLHNRIFC